MNATVRLVAGLGWRDHVTPAMRELHWLPVVYRIKYKLCVMMHAAANGCSSQYISDAVVATMALPTRSSLRSASTCTYDVPRTRTEFGKRAFSIAGPTTWNELPTQIRQTTEIGQFKRALKTHLCSIAYN